MNWKHLRVAPWLDTRAGIVARTPAGGTLLDLGSSDGETLSHFQELRSDLKFFATDLGGSPENYPAGTQFHRGDITRERLPWPDNSIDSITCMHLVEHLPDLTNMTKEVARLLRPGGCAYFETPHPKTVVYDSPGGNMVGKFTSNFYDDTTHIRPVSIGALAQRLHGAGLHSIAGGTSRNILFCLSAPLFWFLPPSRKRCTAINHWRGWSSYLIVAKPSGR